MQVLQRNVVMRRTEVIPAHQDILDADLRHDIDEYAVDRNVDVVTDLIEQHVRVSHSGTLEACLRNRELLLAAMKKGLVFENAFTRGIESHAGNHHARALAGDLELRRFARNGITAQIPGKNDSCPKALPRQTPDCIRACAG